MSIEQRWKFHTTVMTDCLGSRLCFWLVMQCGNLPQTKRITSQIWVEICQQYTIFCTPSSDVVSWHPNMPAAQWNLVVEMLNLAILTGWTNSSLRKQPTFGDVTTGFPAKWNLRNECRNSTLMMHHYPDLGSAFDWSCGMGNLIQPITSTSQIWVVMRHQNGISVLVSQT